MPTIALPPGDYWRLRFLQERVEHAKTRGLLGELRATQAHDEAWTGLTTRYPALGTSDAWALTDADTSLSAPDPPKEQTP
jgi:hypothetical protein